MAALTYRDTTVNPIARCCAISIAAVLFALAGCGGDDEETASAPATTSPGNTVDTVETSDLPAATVTVPDEPADTGPGSPEDQTGGAGDEVPAQSLALLTGRGGRITPRVVRVPAFISVRVELRSADGASYGLRFGGRTLAVGDGLRSVSRRFAGLRPGKALVGTAVEGSGSVRIEATAEPGP